MRVCEFEMQYVKQMSSRYESINTHNVMRRLKTRSLHKRLLQVKVYRQWKYLHTKSKLLNANNKQLKCKMTERHIYMCCCRCTHYDCMVPTTLHYDILDASLVFNGFSLGRVTSDWSDRYAVVVPITYTLDGTSSYMYVSIFKIDSTRVSHVVLLSYELGKSR